MIVEGSEVTLSLEGERGSRRVEITNDERLHVAAWVELQVTRGSSESRISLGRAVKARLEQQRRNQAGKRNGSVSSGENKKPPYYRFCAFVKIARSNPGWREGDNSKVDFRYGRYI